ncbi:hypothetical protein ACFPOI_24270 [Nonomuraea angiospora]|uniref:Uncharacterized protein n=1 Tax=Nonomuraea angiospora TaxID=46172 RepID=A0ABR9MLG8_9ACTN|nr:hypothetical protein [Nonomuraea angiospora]MBE1593794.1 hypothetical protein [Nonomuraea angiospora]
MDGFLDETRSGVTELRVHGVSGTPPEGMLNHPHPWIVAGDGTTGFYRRWWTDGPPDGEHADVPDSRHREAYAWGGLTSGGKTIALWLLLLLFALANLSYSLRRLYAAFFPAYFGAGGLSAVRAAVPWYNLYRLSDPIGGPVFGRVDPLAPRSFPNGVDVFCWDPHRPAPGEPLPEARWHSDYWLDPEYDAALSRLIVVKPFA